MTRSAELAMLHNRLISDTSTALIPLGDMKIRLTTAGIAWLKEYARYRRIWLAMLKDGDEPAAALRERFSYVEDSDDDVATDVVTAADAQSERVQAALKAKIGRAHV